MGALVAVSAAAVTKLLATSAVTTIVSTRVFDELPPNPTYPCVEVRVQIPRPQLSFGTSEFPEVGFRAHCYSRADAYNGMGEVNGLADAVLTALKNQALTVSGYTQAGAVFVDDVPQAFRTEIYGVQLREVVVLCRTYVHD